MASPKNIISNHPNLRRKISHDAFRMEIFKFDAIETIRTDIFWNRYEDKEDLNEISSLLSNIQISTSGKSEDSQDDCTESTEIRNILNCKSIKMQSCSDNLSRPIHRPKTITMTGRVLHSDSNLTRLTKPVSAPNGRIVPERVFNPFIKNFQENQSDC
jgi:hypothetical protein